MSCTLCQEPFTLEPTPAKLYFITEFEELNAKIKAFWQRMGYVSQEHDGIVFIQVADAQGYFIAHQSAHGAYFSAQEQGAIAVYIQPEGTSMQFGAMLKAKSLARYLHLIEDAAFFDIVNNHSLTSHFQPIVTSRENAIYGYETLVRGVHADGTLMYPQELFSKSARNEMDFKLDKLCRESALKTAAVKNVHQKVFINFMPTAIYDPKFCLSATTKWANQLEFDPKNIVFEVVETEQVKDKKHLRTILEYYREQGYLIALDDVGEGYSGLNTLIEIKPDIIKVDRQIISNIDTDSFKQSVYKALVGIATDHGIKVLAEGVERLEEVQTVEALGADYLQGFYFSKPQAEPVRKL